MIKERYSLLAKHLLCASYFLASKKKFHHQVIRDAGIWQIDRDYIVKNTHSILEFKDANILEKVTLGLTPLEILSLGYKDIDNRYPNLLTVIGHIYNIDESIIANIIAGMGGLSITNSDTSSYRLGNYLTQCFRYTYTSKIENFKSSIDIYSGFYTKDVIDLFAQFSKTETIRKVI